MSPRTSSILIKTVRALSAPAVLAALALSPAAALAAPPLEPVTEPVTGVAATTAQFNGVLSPGFPGEFGSTFQFLYKATSTATKAECETGATKTPEPAGVANGGESEAVAIGVGELTPATEYVVCLAATNTTAETTVGPAVAFKTALPPEAPTTLPATEVEGTTASVHGILNPLAPGEAGTYEFVYSPSAAGCQAEGEAVTPPEPATGTEAEEVTANLTGLVGNTTYSVCLRAANGVGESALGAPETFKTNAEKPVISSQSALNVTPFAASLQAEVNPENDTATSCTFEYGKTAVTDNSVPCEQIEVAGSAVQIVTRNLSGLSPASKYKYRVVVTNGTGTTEGAEQEFETLAAEKPAVANETVSAIQPFQARLEGTVNPNFQATKCTFSYGSLLVSEFKQPCEPEILEGSGEQPVGTTITGLTPGTTYHYLIAAKNASGLTEGEAEFTTLSLEAPIFASENPSEVTNTDAKLEARVNPDAQETTSWGFEYGPTAEAVEEGKGTLVPGEPQLPAVYEEVTAGPVDLGGKLTPNTTYFYRLTATNASGTLHAPVQEFTTLAAEPPVIASESASAVTETGVSFNATINPLGQEKTTYRFEYATDEAFTENVGSAAGKTALFAFNEDQETETVTVKSGLKGGTVYFYRVVASNPVMGSANGPTQQFKTLAKPAVVSNTPGEPTRTAVSVSGSVNPGGTATTYRFVFVPASEFEPGASKCPEEVACAYAKGTSTASKAVAATGYAPEAVGPQTLEELKPSTTYHYTLVATNSTGSSVGNDQTFTTAAATRPTVSVSGASGIGQSSATLTGSVGTQGLTTTARFLVGSESGNLTAVPTSTSLAGETMSVAASVGGLQPGSTYYYRLTASNSDGNAESGVGSFATAAGSGTAGQATMPAVPFTPLTTLNADEAKQNNASSRGTVPLTKKQLLAKAMKKCHRDKKKSKRKTCEKAAQKKYGPKRGK